MRKFYGKYRAIVRDIHDPKMRGRVRAEVPSVLGTGIGSWSSWAEPCFQANAFQVPEEGDGVWIEFEAGDVGRPIWSGIWYKGAGPTSEAPMQHVHDALVDMDGNEVDTDKRDHTGPDEVDDLEHKEYHNHSAGEFYTPHRFGWQSHTGHVIEVNDHPGRQGRLVLLDRVGRVVELCARGVSRLRGLFVSSASGGFKNLDGEDTDAYHELVFADFQNDDLHGTDPYEEGYVPASSEAADSPVAAKWYVLLRDMAGHALRMVSDVGKEHVRLSDYWGQHVLVQSVPGQEKVQVLDKSGQSVTLDAAQSSITVQGVEGQSVVLDGVSGRIVVSGGEGSTIILEGGKVSIASASSDIELEIPSGANLVCSGQALATEAFVDNVFKNHIHQTPAGPSTPPTPLGVENVWPQVTKNKT